MVLEKTLESPLDCKEVQPVHPKDQSWVFIGRTDVEAETPILAGFLSGSVKSPPAMQETWVQSLGWEDHLEKGIATYSSILAWRIPMDRGAWQAVVHGVAKNWT